MIPTDPNLPKHLHPTHTPTLIMAPAAPGFKDEIFPTLGTFQGKASDGKAWLGISSSRTVGTQGAEGCEATLENELGLGPG